MKILQAEKCFQNTTHVTEKTETITEGACSFWWTKVLHHAKLMVKTIPARWHGANSDFETANTRVFYAPPSASADALRELARKIETIKTDYIAIAGDFNLPDINWSQQPSYPGVTGGINV